ncbi:hypothetical protein [Clostridium cuniculi]|uniref:hypothetical protein n=1 Tax=Clostridium cuniculi TaxID=2548455 RepID=UPI0010568F8B|nr:hypothetical protein [Clostridium cuniculi]
MEKVIYDFKDLGLASYLIANGGSFKGIQIKYVKRFNEFKIFVRIEGEKDYLLKMRDYYEENKIQILKSKTIISMVNKLSDRVERILKNEEENTF